MDDAIEPIRVFGSPEQGGTFEHLSTGDGLVAQVPSEQLPAWERIVARAAAYDALLESLAKADA